ncbi:ribulose-phosphate 3-epimerase [Candidatus Woesearchaeota archaeon]|nr:ribulose-phosphate 3-epimerase [Candidatus Woesearchaeota archaeon]
MKIKIAPSILSAKREELQDEVKEIEKIADMVHVDIMDGKFVPPKTFLPNEIEAVKSKLPKDVHLMVNYPIKDGFIDAYVDAGASIITVHQESLDDVGKCIAHIKQRGIKAGITINPPTPVQKIFPYLDQVDMVLIMSVNPGYAGQKFIPEVLEKIKVLRSMKPELDIEIDGGISKTTIKKAAAAGANVFVAGSAIFNKDDRIKAIRELRDALE